MARSKLGRVAAFTALWNAVRGAQGPGSAGVGQRVRVLPRMLGLAATGRYPYLGAGRIAALAMALVYVVSPVDLVPEIFLPLIGVGDDAVVLAWVVGSVLAEAERFLAWEGGRSSTDEAPADPSGAPRTVPGEVLV